MSSFQDRGQYRSPAISTARLGLFRKAHSDYRKKSADRSKVVEWAMVGPDFLVQERLEAEEIVAGFDRLATVLSSEDDY